MTMPPEPDPTRLEELFATALELDTDRRASWLESACAGDQLLRQRLDQLLAASSGEQLAPIDPTRAARLLESNLQPEPEEIGSYRIIDRLGEGGMGTVYLAERIEGGFEQRVALKLIKRGMDSDAILARFQQERQILARLEHPAIARLLEGGSTSDGRPYFAMEYVDGVPITVHASERRLSVGAILELAVEVCDAVQHAHRNLVVHRDLKPSNVLVTSAGRVKLVDFGIAKLLARDEAEGSDATVLGARALTLDYASPEQVKGEVVTTASDVYSLGVLLFELLAGCSPYGAEPSSVEQKVRRIEEGDVPRLSAAARRAHPGEHGRALARRLAGDLDAVLAKALARDPARRYASAEALAEDLGRHLRSEPVRARAPARWYRAERFLRRHRLGVALAAAAILALVAGLAGTAWQARVAARERDRAESHAARAEAVQDFLTSLLQSVDPYRTGGAPWTAEELLDRGVERIDAGALGNPLVAAELLGVMGGVGRSLGQLERSETLWRRSLALRRDQLPGSPELAEGLRGLAAVLYIRGSHDEAEALLLEALELERGRPRTEPRALARTLEQLGVLLHERSQHAAARAHYEEALGLLRTVAGDTRAETAGLLANLGGLHQAAGELEAAETLQREALELELAVLGPAHPGLAVTMGNLAATLRQRGDWEGAERLHREALAISRAALGDEHPEVATKLSNLAAVLRSRGAHEEAAAVFREVLALDRKLLGERHAYVAFSLDNLAGSLAELGELDEALAAFALAHEILRESRGERSVEVASNRVSTAVALALAGRPAEAEPLLVTGLELYGETLAPNHPRRARAIAALGAVLVDLGRDVEAEAHFRDALELRGQARHPETVAPMVGLGRLLLRGRALDEALALLESAADIARETLPGEHVDRVGAELALASALRARGDHARAAVASQAAHAALGRGIGPRWQRLRAELAATGGS